MSKIDIWQIVSEIEKESVPNVQKQIEEHIDSINGQSMNQNEIIEKVVIPIFGISSTANKKFTVDLIERVVDELEKDKQS